MSEDLYIAGQRSKAIKQNIAQFLSFKNENDTVWDFEHYNEPMHLEAIFMKICHMESRHL